jgi:hypothetical protein
MKKLLTTLTVTLFALASFAQSDVFTTVFVQSGDWDKKNETYIWEDDIHKAQIEFTFQQQVILVQDEANSVYVTSNYQEEDEASYWDAIDENGTKCLIVMYNEYGYIILEVFYGNLCFRYYFDEEN